MVRSAKFKAPFSVAMWSVSAWAIALRSWWSVVCMGLEDEKLWHLFGEDGDELLFEVELCVGRYALVIYRCVSVRSFGAAIEGCGLRWAFSCDGG